MHTPPLESDGNTLRKAVWAILSILASFAESRGRKVTKVPLTLKYLVNLILVLQLSTVRTYL